ncbi:MAG TPA: rubrerythrin family protein, partial [Flexistipes sinusarabici]|nr:rubrerythrin family protein [Flexistipes sinusarabici]
ISEYFLYHKIADGLKVEQNKRLLKDIAEDELRHYKFLKSVTGKDVKPDRFKIFLYFWITKIFGLTFGIKLLERGEEAAVKAYEE